MLIENSLYKFITIAITIIISEQNGRKRQSLQSKPSLIWFRFNEGYSNAVRKSVKVQEFLWKQKSAITLTFVDKVLLSQGRVDTNMKGTNLSDLKYLVFLK